ncbi:dihydrolipoyl dehydrogenase [Alcaligenaceae bacterium]|nr:dihydrolipoyl dehydrogenase [Alcaligenaceae bacterium]
MNTSTDFDLIIVGSGPGGYVAAIRASQLKMRVCLIERSDLGGVCLNWGCIPTKTLLHTATTLSAFQNAASLGIQVPDGLGIDIKRVVQRSRDVAKTLGLGVSALLKKNQVTVVQGSARLLGAGQVEVSNPQKTQKPQCLHAKNIIIATGASPRDIRGFPVDGKGVWNYKHALTPEKIPSSLLILGAGAIGMEFASFYAALGSQVTLAEQQSRILPQEDEEVSAWMLKAFTQRKISVRVNTTATLLESVSGRSSVSLTQQGNSETLAFEQVLVCAGVIGNTQDMGLENTNIIPHNGCISTDFYGQTSEPNIFAIGDVSGAPMLAHKASHQGMRCVEHIAGLNNPISTHAIPACTYSDPQVASMGLTESEARAQHPNIAVGRFPLHGNGKALAIGKPEGFIKTLFDQDTGAFLGAHMVGSDVTELLHGLTLAQQLEATEDDLIQHMFAHPTLSEALGESVMAAYGRAIHI